MKNKKDIVELPTGTDLVETKLERLLERHKTSVAQITQYNDVLLQQIIEDNTKMGAINGRQALVLLNYYRDQLWNSQKSNGSQDVA